LKTFKFGLRALQAYSIWTLKRSVLPKFNTNTISNAKAWCPCISARSHAGYNYDGYNVRDPRVLHRPRYDHHLQ
jgi:hypothetical protein